MSGILTEESELRFAGSGFACHWSRLALNRSRSWISSRRWSWFALARGRHGRYKGWLTLKRILLQLFMHRDPAFPYWRRKLLLEDFGDHDWLLAHVRDGSFLR